mmetsp:Transcript_30171/g.46013  ORF Transcript_30171/g.46013 Transcript_30171/m.46013 type:complete len:1643 (+) Transcript_30171:315-5243(+)
MTLRTESTLIPDSWVTYWLHQAEDADQINTLVTILRFYVWHCKRSILNNSLDSDRMINAYTQLRPISRPLFVNAISECLTPNEMRPLFSSITAAAVLNHSAPFVERTMVLDTIIRVTWLFSRENKLHFDNLSWHLEAIIMLLESSEDNFLIHTMAHNWLLQLIDILSVMHGDLSFFFATIVEDVLPKFFHGRLATLSLQPILTSTLKIAERCRVSDRSVFKLLGMALSIPVQSVLLGFLEIVEILTRRSTKTTDRLREAIPFMCATTGEQFSTLAMKLSTPFSQVFETKDASSYVGINPEDFDEFLRLIGKRISKLDASKTSVLTQNRLLILACVLLYDKNNESVKTMVKELLSKFPYLGISMLPALVLSIQESTNHAKLALSRLNFVCESVVQDPHCAQEIWSLIGLTFAQKDKPLSLRLAAIQTYPILCSNNRRLYRRIIDSLGNFVDESQIEVRLAVAAVIAQLAKEDQIRDVSDVIGWVQSYLTDEVPSVVHLSISSLHHMIVNGELDFDVVIKVVGNKICPLDDLEEVLQLHHIIIESLVVLLGSGEIEAEDHDSDEEARVISRQITVAIQALLKIASSDFLASLHENEATNRIRFNILKSLSNYSLGALGIEEQGVKAATASEQAPDSDVSARYTSITLLLRDGLVNPENNTNGEDPIIELSKKVISYEEEVLGVAIWQKGFKKSYNTRKKKSNKVSKSTLAALPAPEDIFKLYADDPCASTSIASLLCFDGQDVDMIVDYAGDLANETLSPILRLLSIQGLFHAMARTWSRLLSNSSASLADNICSTVSDIKGWEETLDSADFPFLALASLSTYLPENFEAVDGSDSNVKLTPIVSSILADIEQAYNEHQFSDLDNGNLCLALSGARSLRNGGVDSFTAILKRFERSCEDGSATFGIHYGLALMVQSIPTGSELTHSYVTTDKSQCHNWVGKIVGCLVNELHFCFTERIPLMIELVSCLQNASASPKLLQDFDKLSMQTIQNSSTIKATGLLMSLGISIHSLANVCPDLLNCIFKLLCKLPLGSGMEYALSSIISNKTTANVIGEGDVESLSKKVRNSFHEPSALYLWAALIQNEEENTSWLEENIELVGDVCMNHAVSIVPFLGTLPVLTCGQTSPLSQAGLFPKTTAKAISAVRQMLDDFDSDSALVVKGLLSSMQLPEITLTSGLSYEASKPSIATKSICLELPTPMAGTLLYHLLSLMREEMSRLKMNKADANIALLCRIFQCLESLSLPGQFAENILGPLIESENTELRISALKLLFSQFTKRRRAAFEGREFVNLSIKVVTREKMLLSGDGLFFYSGMYDLIRKSSSDLSENILQKSWQNCLSLARQNSDQEAMCKWLEGFRTLLFKIQEGSSVSLSPKTVDGARRFLVKDVFTDVVRASAYIPIDETFNVFTECLIEIPSTIIDECSFFLFQADGVTKEQLWRARCIITLVNNEKLESKETMLKLIKSIVVWISRQHLARDEQLILQKISLLMASATENLEEANKHECILLILEVMLIHGPESFALNLLGLLLNGWGAHSQSQSLASLSVQRIAVFPKLSHHSLSQIQLFTLQEMPMNLKYLLKGTKVQHLIYNRLCQVHGAWAKIRAPENELDLLLKMLNCCKSGESDTYITAEIASRLALSASRAV